MKTSASVWLGRVMSGLFALFMLGASVTPKLMGMPVAEETMAQLGWPPGYAFAIGVLELTLVAALSVPAHQRARRDPVHGPAGRGDGDSDSR